MERGDRQMVVIARLRAAPLVAWQAMCLGVLAALLNRLDWDGTPADIFWTMVYVHPVAMLSIAAVLGMSAYGLGLWRRRGAYVRHDGVMLYRGGSARWPLALIRDVVVTRGELGVESLRLVVDDDSEVTRELVKLYMLDGRPEAVRDGVMFAAGRVRGFAGSVAVH